MARPRPSSPAARIEAIKAQIGTIDLVLRGTLSRRTKVCGKALCRCHVDRAARHGPYFEYGQMVRGKRSSETLRPDQAAAFVRAMHNRRRLDRLMREWEALSVKALRPPNDAST